MTQMSKVRVLQAALSDKIHIFILVGNRDGTQSSEDKWSVVPHSPLLYFNNVRQWMFLSI